MIQNNEREDIILQLWEKYLESDDFDEQLIIYYPTENNKKYLENDEQQITHYTNDNDNDNDKKHTQFQVNKVLFQKLYDKRYNILNMLTKYDKQEMLEMYCQKTMQKRQGKLLTELEDQQDKSKDGNIYLLSVSVCSLDDPKYALEIIEKNSGYIYYMAHMLEEAVLKIEEILQKDYDKTYEILENKYTLEYIKKQYNDEKLIKNMQIIFNKMLIIEKIMDQKLFFKIYQLVFSNNDEYFTLYDYLSVLSCECLSEKLMLIYQQMCLDQDPCSICSENINKLSTKITICQQCQNYFHEKCTTNTETCPLCRNQALTKNQIDTQCPATQNQIPVLQISPEKS